MNKAFTLIELLVVIAIIGVLVTISLFGLQGVREIARNERRKTDLEMLRGQLEIFRSECGLYPGGLPATGGKLNGGNRCPGITFIQSMPGDPQEPVRAYEYVGLTNKQEYALCASLEGSSDPVPKDCPTNCGNERCNHSVRNP